MDDPMTGTGPAIDFDRRALLRRGAIVLGATALWTTPVVQTLGMRAAAAGTHPTEAVLCPDGESAPSNLVFRYEAAAATLANIEIRRARGPAPGTWCAEVLAGKTFQVPLKANPEMTFAIVTDEGTESLTLHTSCSQELTIGQRFGSLTLVGGLNSDGDRVGTTDAKVIAVPGECRPMPSTEEDEVEDLGEDDAEAEAEAEAAADKEEATAEQDKAEKAAAEKAEETAAAEKEKVEAEEAAAEKEEATAEQDKAEKAAAEKAEETAAAEKGKVEAEEAAAEKEKAEAQEAAAEQEKAETEDGKEAEKSIGE